MREIKFKVFFPNFKRMMRDDEVNDHLMDVIRGKLVSNAYEQHEYGDLPEYYKDTGYVLLQYTGLKDRNGVEIYEGDILNIYYYDYNAGETQSYMQEVKSILSGCLVYVVECDYDVTSLYFIYDSMEDVSLEVIGNIYENPELLK